MSFVNELSSYGFESRCCHKATVLTFKGKRVGGGVPKSKSESTDKQRINDDLTSKQLMMIFLMGTNTICTCIY